MKTNIPEHTSKKIAIYTLGLAIVAFAGTAVAFAEDAGTRQIPPPRQPMMQPLRVGDKNEMGGDHPRMASTTAALRQKLASTTQLMQDDRKELASTTQAIRKDIHVDMQTARQNMQVTNMARVAWIKVNATIIRLGKIIDKLDTRIAKVKAAGNATTVAEAASADAKTSLGKATIDLNTIKSIISSISSTTPLDTTATTTMHMSGQDAETQIKTAQTDIEKALQSLQGLQANDHASVETHASTTRATQ